MVTYYVKKNEIYNIKAIDICRVYDSNDTLIVRCEAGESIEFKAPTDKISISDANAALTRVVNIHEVVKEFTEHTCNEESHIKPDERVNWDTGFTDATNHINNGEIHVTAEQKQVLDDMTLKERVLNINQLWVGMGSGEKYDMFTLEQALNLGDRYVTQRGLTGKISGGLKLKFKGFDGKFYEYMWNGEGVLNNVSSWVQIVTDLESKASMFSLVGEIKNYAGSSVPDGYLLCDGSEVSRTTYAALFAAIGTLWGAGDGESTFTLPNLIDRVLWGATGSGEYLEAGLPNITGSLVITDENSPEPAYLVVNTATGAFNKAKQSGELNLGFFEYGHPQTGGYTKTTFDASRSSAIYGSSTTVQPPAAKVIPIIKY